MDQNQFQAFTDGIAQMFNSLNDGMGVQYADQKNRDRLKNLIKSVRICDGNVPAEVREWIDEVEMTIPISPNLQGATIQIAARTVAGPLKKEVERFLGAQPNRLQTPWATLRDHVRTAFLSANESERLKSELEKMMQSSYENLGTFNRRFREAAIKAYPGQRSADAERSIIRAIVENRPATLDAAIQ